MSVKSSFLLVPLRFWIGLSIALITICLVLVMTLFNMSSEIRVMPQLFRRNTMNANQFMEATAINKNVPLKESKLIDEMLIRFYIENRYFYVPDRDELTYRYGVDGPVWRLSSSNVYNSFIASKGNFIEDTQKNFDTTTVDIWQINRRDNVFYVDFDIYHITEGKQGFGGTKRATVKIAHDQSRGDRSLKYWDFVNPYGFYVVSYDETALKKR